MLNNVEDGLLYIDAPNSDVILTLKGLHDSSFINCRNLQIVISEDFFEANILEVSAAGEITSLLDDLEEIKEMGAKPTLYVRATGHKEVNVMTSFEILKM